MKKTCQTLLILSALSLLCFQPIQGTEPLEKQSSTTELVSKDRIIIEKKLSKKEMLSEQKERRKIAEDNKAKAKKICRKASPQLASKSPCGMYSSYNINPLYIIKSIGATGRTLTFDNETIWEISDSSSYTARNWAPGSYVVIIPNTSWFSSYTYRLENVLDHSSVSANLSEGPFMKYAIFIAFIDRMTNTVGLSDNSIWTVATDSQTLRLFHSWQNGQAILVGENRGWFGWPNGNILVNINENAYIPVHPAR